MVRPVVYLALKAIGAAKKAEEEEEIEVDKSCVGDIFRFFTAAHGFWEQSTEVTVLVFWKKLP